jgi:hypothetical protein
VYRFFIFYPNSKYVYGRYQRANKIKIKKLSHIIQSFKFLLMIYWSNNISASLFILFIFYIYFLVYFYNYITMKELILISQFVKSSFSTNFSPLLFKHFIARKPPQWKYKHIINEIRLYVISLLYSVKKMGEQVFS